MLYLFNDSCIMHCTPLFQIFILSFSQFITDVILIYIVFFDYQMPKFESCYSFFSRNCFVVECISKIWRIDQFMYMKYTKIDLYNSFLVNTFVALMQKKKPHSMNPSKSAFGILTMYVYRWTWMFDYAWHVYIRVVTVVFDHSEFKLINY